MLFVRLSRESIRSTEDEVYLSQNMQNMRATGVLDQLNVLTPEQVEFYNENGYLHIPQMFTQAETDELAEHLDWLIDTWAMRDQGWTGPWRKKYMDAATEKKSQLIALHDLYYYSDAWSRAVTKKKLCGAMADLIGPVVELHHSTLHVKPPESGHPFPMHQDWAFYKHANDRYVDVLVHLDDTRHENGEIRFLAGSHKMGPLDHIVKDEEGKGCTPHLPFEKYKLEDTTAVPAKRGDIVVFNILTIHGSYINVTDRMRRLVRIGYKDPANEQTEGQSKGRPSWIVWGRRPKRGGQQIFPTQ
jgi:ectoine hydroxylase-related dioxygenase (phytanoyl-CoA dioxygenase family)